jgi:hypothetical protein
MKLFIATATCIALAGPAAAESTAQKDFPTARFYAPDGKAAGSATTYGDQTKFYGPDGRLLGTAAKKKERAAR